MRLAHAHRRAGFTLVEILVAAALTILIMTVMATGFQMALQSFSTLKTAGDLSDRIRTAETMLRRDLEADHFDSGPGPGVLRLSDLRLDQDPTVRPAGGFVQIRQTPHPVGFTTLEGSDQDNLSSTVAVTHSLSLTVRRTGKTAGDLFAAPLAPEPMVIGPTGIIATNPTDVAVVANTYLSEWAEVHWFLDTNRPTVVNGVNTFPLIRRVRLLTNTTPVTGVIANNPTLPDVVSVFPSGSGNMTTNNLISIATPANRLGNGATPTSIPVTLPASPATSNPRFGDDIVITNVIGFEVKPTWETPTVANQPRATIGATTALRVNGDFPFDDFPTNNLGPAPQPNILFDTFMGGFQAASGPVMPARVTGVQIKIRIYEGKNKMTRQSVVTGKL